MFFLNFISIMSRIHLVESLLTLYLVFNWWKSYSVFWWVSSVYSPKVKSTVNFNRQHLQSISVSLGEYLFYRLIVQTALFLDWPCFKFEWVQLLECIYLYFPRTHFWTLIISIFQRCKFITKCKVEQIVILFINGSLYCAGNL